MSFNKFTQMCNVLAAIWCGYLALYNLTESRWFAVLICLCFSMFNVFLAYEMSDLIQLDEQQKQ